MLQMHQRHLYNTFDPPGEDIDLRRSFPRLVLSSVAEPLEFKTPVDDDESPKGISVWVFPRHVELFRPVTFDELSTLLLPVTSGDMNICRHLWHFPCKCQASLSPRFPHGGHYQPGHQEGRGPSPAERRYGVQHRTKTGGRCIAMMGRTGNSTSSKALPIPKPIQRSTSSSTFSE